VHHRLDSHRNRIPGTAADISIEGDIVSCCLPSMLC
jgi:hypothetical protein